MTALHVSEACGESPVNTENQKTTKLKDPGNKTLLRDFCFDLVSSKHPSQVEKPNAQRMHM